MAQNPLELKRKTHLLAKAHLRRFTHDAERSMLFAYDRRINRVLRVRFDVGGIFNVDGVWSHRAENLMERIEEAFWKTLDEVDSSGKISSQNAVSEYYALWRARVHYSQIHKDFEEPLIGITLSDLTEEVDVAKGEKVVTVTQQDLLEHRGVGFYSTDLQASARSGSWMTIRCLMDQHLKILEDVKWGIVEFKEGSLVLPDRPIYRDIPVGPRTILHGYTKQERYHAHVVGSRRDAEEWNRGFFDGALHAVGAHSRETLDALVESSTKR